MILEQIIKIPITLKTIRKNLERLLLNGHRRIRPRWCGFKRGVGYCRQVCPRLIKRVVSRLPVWISMPQPHPIPKCLRMLLTGFSIQFLSEKVMLSFVSRRSR
ncbi:hypothetical protein Htur_4979 (plasmid) [Haloterrigena turkmenica DSM 5511]|uniref:Uncharacterized protein n=1 Tax=Haloterrigena turkmenica (strain ATCC 51198 / DSM 5511 / JCM 9101 / NCIMB 13204 / VKM B-1734 / 4k) TaxID=543526 RepID=D2S2W4_HALTV|nr:hypothetical protein Htur_4979 [Haloterrigena turkmenica DSM 5511]